MAKYAIGLSETNFVIVSLNPCGKIIVAEKNHGAQILWPCKW